MIGKETNNGQTSIYTKNISIFAKDLLFAVTFCIKKYLLTCCEILTDDEHKVRNIFYLLLSCCTLQFFYVLRTSVCLCLSVRQWY